MRTRLKLLLAPLIVTASASAHGQRISRTYEEVEDKTTITLQEQRLAKQIALDVSFSFKGREVNQVDTFTFKFRRDNNQTEVHAWIVNPTILLRVGEGEPETVEATYQFIKVPPMTGLLRQQLTITLSLEELERMTKAEKVLVKIGNISTEIGPRQLKALAKLLAVAKGLESQPPGMPSGPNWKLVSCRSVNYG